MAKTQTRKSTPISRHVRPKEKAKPLATRLDIARSLLTISRALHETRETTQRQRELLAGLCRLIGADRGVLALTGIDPATARHQVHSAVEVDLAGTSDVNGPCLDSFRALSSIRRVGCITLSRSTGGGKFTAADRALVEMAHAQFDWVYGEGEN